ncbi:IS110 family transposase [Anaeromyxobacter sp. SG64]|uniref:IS110 family transposase n=1 Tax=Anaeromyxobacter sp. SG64 TaxID=2925409 RepID=UPI001F569672|nr:IS110 family transposase [Anaeromyxobacter sp. SG64]
MQKVITHVGLDVHAERIVLASLEGTSREPVVRDIPNDPKVIRRTFQRLAASAHELRCCYEAGPCGYEVFRQLEAMGIECEVVAPALIPVKAGDRVKTDRRDATKLARLYRAGELTTITVPTSDQEAVRDLVRAREDVRKDLTAARHRLGKFLIRHGRLFRGGKNWTLRFWDWLRKQEFEREGERLTFEHYVTEVQHLVDRRARLEREIERIAKNEPYAAPVAKLSCLRGISVLAAMALLCEIHDFRRFDTPRKLMAYVGLVPSEYSSGGKEKRGGITKTGSSHARRILVEAAWSYRHRPAFSPRAAQALRDQPPEIVEYARRSQLRLHKRFRQLVGHGKGSQVAVTAVARELCGFVWGIMTA